MLGPVHIKSKRSNAVILQRCKTFLVTRSTHPCTRNNAGVLKNSSPGTIVFEMQRCLPVTWIYQQLSSRHGLVMIEHIRDCGAPVRISVNMP